MRRKHVYANRAWQSSNRPPSRARSASQWLACIKTPRERCPDLSPFGLRRLSVVMRALRESTSSSKPQSKKSPMRKGKTNYDLPIYGLRYGADTSGLTAENAPEFIRKRAYQLFEGRGRQSGHELDDWLQAEHEMKVRLG